MTVVLESRNPDVKEKLCEAVSRWNSLPWNAQSPRVTYTKKQYLTATQLLSLFIGIEVPNEMCPSLEMWILDITNNAGIDIHCQKWWQPLVSYMVLWGKEYGESYLRSKEPLPWTTRRAVEQLYPGTAFQYTEYKMGMDEVVVMTHADGSLVVQKPMFEGKPATGKILESVSNPMLGISVGKFRDAVEYNEYTPINLRLARGPKDFFKPFVMDGGELELKQFGFSENDEEDD